MRNFILAVLFFLVGCGSINTYSLDNKWSPLNQLVEQPGSDKQIETVGDKIFITNLNRWLEQNPPNGVDFDCIMHHERIHSLRQFKYGLIKWWHSFVKVRSWRWYEEQLGWYIQLKMNDRYGGPDWTVDEITNTLWSYWPKLATMDEIRRWVVGVKTGQWQPNPGDLMDYEVYEWMR